MPNLPRKIQKLSTLMHIYSLHSPCCFFSSTADVVFNSQLIIITYTHGLYHYYTCIIHQRLTMNLQNIFSICWFQVYLVSFLIFANDVTHMLINLSSIDLTCTNKNMLDIFVIKVLAIICVLDLLTLMLLYIIIN